MPYLAPEAPMPMTSCAPRFAEINARPATHAGIARPARKKSVLVFIELFRDAPMPRTNAKYRARINQSIPVILERLLPLDYLPIRGTRSATQMRVYEARSVHEETSLPQENAQDSTSGECAEPLPAPQFSV